MSTTAFPSNPEMTSIVSAYKNEQLVSDQVCPLTQAVNKKTFKYDSFPVGEQLTAQDDRVSRRGEIPEISGSSVENTSSIEDHALSDYVPYDDVKSANDPSRVLNMTALRVRGIIALNREIRVANLIFNTQSYEANRVLTIASDADKITNPNVNALDLITNQLDGMLQKANTLVISQAGWSALRSNPFIVKAVHKNAGDTGLASVQAVADLLELEKIIVARANRNVNNNPKSLNHGRIWGNHLSLIYLEPATQAGGSFTFCTTVPYESNDGITAGTDFDKKRGVRGSHEVRIAQQVKELIIAREAGSLITNIV